MSTTTNDQAVRLAAGNTSAIFDGMTWPTAGEACGNLEWRLRHDPKSITLADLVSAASVLAAYRELVVCPDSKRRAIVRRLREARAMES